jgi:hypothetical protein
MVGSAHPRAEDFSCLATKSPVAQAFQPVPAQAKACGYILKRVCRPAFFAVPHFSLFPQVISPFPPFAFWAFFPLLPLFP